jgi:ribosomal protein S18 acetylase RimI-like enzyme
MVLRRMSDAELAAVADLERRVVDHDGGRLKLEWGALRSRSGEQVEDLLWADGDRVLGFLGFYCFGGQELELAGMVDPAVRRTGIATALLDAAVPLGRERGFARALLVTPRATPAGREFAEAKGAEFEHSEHHLELGRTPDSAEDPRVGLRKIADADIEPVRRILAAAFGGPAGTVTVADDPDEQTLVIDRDDTVVGVLRVSREGDTNGIYGFAVDPACQGQGIGRDVLARVCRQLRAQGRDPITLEVAVDNDRALGLYLSVGFEPRTTEDYFAKPLG